MCRMNKVKWNRPRSLHGVKSDPFCRTVIPVWFRQVHYRTKVWGHSLQKIYKNVFCLYLSDHTCTVQHQNRILKIFEEHFQNLVGKYERNSKSINQSFKLFEKKIMGLLMMCVSGVCWFEILIDQILRKLAMFFRVSFKKCHNFE